MILVQEDQVKYYDTSLNHLYENEHVYIVSPTNDGHKNLAIEEEAAKEGLLLRQQP
jgi:hypothetical protein